MEVSRLFSWYKLVACKSPAFKDFPFDLLFLNERWKNFFLNYKMLCLFLMPVALSGDPDLPNTTCSPVMKTFKHAARYPASSSAAAKAILQNWALPL